MWPRRPHQSRHKACSPDDLTCERDRRATRRERRSPPGSPGSAPRSSPRCRRSPWRPARSTSGRAFPTPTGRTRCSMLRSPAIRAGVNQYPPGPGDRRCCAQAIAEHQRRFYGLDVDPDSEVLVTAGATEALAGALLGMLDAGDEVVVFEPMYDSYQACIALAGAVAAPVVLRPRGPTVTTASTATSCAPRLTPHQARSCCQHPAQPHRQGVRPATSWPSIAELALEHDVIVVTDEVYEHLVFDGAEHVPIATLPGMARSHADDLVRRQDVQHDRLEDRLGLRPGGIRRRRPRPPSSSSPTSTGRRSSRRSPSGWDCPTSTSSISPPIWRPSATAFSRVSSPPASRPTGPRRPTSRPSTSGRCDPTATGSRSAGRCPSGCGVVAIPNQVFYANQRTRSTPGPVRVLQAARGDRRRRRAAGAALGVGARERAPAGRRAARHRVERPRCQLRPPGPTIARARRRRRGARAPDRDVLHRLWVRVAGIRVGEPRAARRRSSSPSRPRSTACGWAARARDPPRRTRRRPAAVELLRARRARWHPAPLPQDPSLLARRRGAPRAPGHRTGHRRRRGIPGLAVRVLRPALRRRVLATRARHRPVPRARQLAGEAT